MKILQLKFKNINSLADVNEIDFTNTAFTNDGLFAITGKTGAGKSSILDAIALALYGKTPRVEVSGADNAVMTRGKTDCYAEITFEVNGKIWKSTWKQERTRTGNLKPVQRQIADASGQIHADQVRSCDAKIIEVLGLNFEQFTKVIMLAQGSFAAFLNANKNDKGELLEQITGTEIYGEISRRVFERHSEEKSKLETLQIELGMINLLSADEIAELQSQVERLQEEKTQLDAAQKKLEKSVNWLQDIEKVQSQIADLKTELPLLQSQLIAAEHDLKEKEHALREAKDKQKSQAPIFRQVRAIDTQLAERNQILQPILTSISDLKIEQDRLNTTINAINTELAQAEINLQNGQTWAANNKRYETLIANYNSIEQENRAVTEATQELEQLQQELQALQTDTSEKSKSVSQAQEMLKNRKLELTQKKEALETRKSGLASILGNETISDLQTRKDIITTFGQQLRELIFCEESRQTSHNEIQRLDITIKDSSRRGDELITLIADKETDLRQIEQQIALLEENILLQRTIQSLEEHRHQLQDGQPCPLCGALEHPFAEGKIPHTSGKEQELTQQKNAAQILIQQINSDKQEKSKVEAAKEYALTQKEKEKARLVKLNETHKSILGELQRIDPDFVLSEDEDRLEQLKTRRLQKLEEFTVLNQKFEQIDALEKQLSNLRDVEIPALDKSVRDAEQAVAHASNQLIIVQANSEAKQKHIEKIAITLEHKKSALLAKLNNYGVDKFEALKDCLDRWNQNQQLCEALSTKISNGKADIAIHKNTLKIKTASLQRSEDEQKALTQEIARLQQQRLEIFGDKIIEEEEENTETAVIRAEQAYNIAQRKHAALTTEVTSQQKLIQNEEKELTELRDKQLSVSPLPEVQEELKTKKTLADELSQQIGAYTQRLNNHAEQQKQAQHKLLAKERQQKSWEKWAILNDLIGSSDGKKYRNFAQVLTFEYLIDLSNKQLQKMSERYILKRSGDSSNPFELHVIDKFQNGEARTAQNLSGGEKFIMSLALALGLANMASKNMRIDTMFIDEGFGTLDSDYLDVALSALSNLQSEGKIIGVISHLSELKERIATHIEVLPTSNGHSRIQISS